MPPEGVFSPPFSSLDLYEGETYTVPNPGEIDEFDSHPAYLFHDACWQLLLSRVSSRQGLSPQDIATADVASVLFQLLQCLHQERYRGFLVRHDYGGVSRFRGPFGHDRFSYERHLKSANWGFALADPNLDLPEETSAYLFRNLPVCAREPVQPAAEKDCYDCYAGHSSSGYNDPFGRLPLEIIDLLLTKLRTVDLCCFRLASRVVARHTPGESCLSQSFWESRFSLDMEMGFFFAAQPPPFPRKEINWHVLYMRLGQALADDSKPNLRNRKRIWTCLSHIEASMTPFFNDANCEWPPQTETPGLQLPWDGHRPGLVIRTHSLFTSVDYPEQKLLLPPLPWPSSLCLTVSFILFNCQRYISGLRLSYIQSNGSHLVLEKAGVLIPETAEHLYLEPDAIPHAIKVYCVSDGIIGLEFFQNECVGNSSGILLGYSSVEQGGVSNAKLYPTAPAVFRGLFLSFDV